MHVDAFALARSAVARVTPLFELFLCLRIGRKTAAVPLKPIKQQPCSRPKPGNSQQKNRHAHAQSFSAEKNPLSPLGRDSRIPASSVANIGA